MKEIEEEEAELGQEKDLDSDVDSEVNSIKELEAFSDKQSEAGSQ